MVEYSELDQSLASAINQETGRLRFCWSNVFSIILSFILLLISASPFLVMVSLSS